MAGASNAWPSPSTSSSRRGSCGALVQLVGVPGADERIAPAVDDGQRHVDRRHELHRRLAPRARPGEPHPHASPGHVAAQRGVGQQRREHAPGVARQTPARTGSSPTRPPPPSRARRRRTAARRSRPSRRRPARRAPAPRRRGPPPPRRGARGPRGSPRLPRRHGPASRRRARRSRPRAAPRPARRPSARRSRPRTRAPAPPCRAAGSRRATGGPRAGRRHSCGAARPSPPRRMW